MTHSNYNPELRYAGDYIPTTDNPYLWIHRRHMVYKNTTTLFEEPLTVPEGAD